MPVRLDRMYVSLRETVGFLFSERQDRSGYRTSFSPEDLRQLIDLAPNFRRISAQRAQRDQNPTVPPSHQITANAWPIVRTSNDQLLQPLDDPLSGSDNNLPFVNIDHRHLVRDTFIGHAIASTDVQQDNPQNVLTDDDFRFVGIQPDTYLLNNSIVLDLFHT